jgi:hypothetical protein
MKIGIPIFLVVLILQTVSFFIPETKAQEKDLAEIKNKEEIQRILKLRIEVRTGSHKEILRAMGLKCEWGKDEAVCNASVSQMAELRQAEIEFEIEREGIDIEKIGFGYKISEQGKGDAYGENENDYSIPLQEWTHSPITITSAPAGATVTSIDVYYYVVHPYVGDLIIDLTDENVDHEWNLWYLEGGSGENIEEAEWDITEFNGELVNQTWKLWGWDCYAGYDGYIDYWSIQIWYEDLPDLIVQSLTATDYNPNVGDYIDVTMIIKNQGEGIASPFWNGLFYDLSEPPEIETVEDEYWWISGLEPGVADTHTFYDITSIDAETWHMYGLADCDGYVVETSEANNYKGPITINWNQPLPDLIVQSLTLDDYSLVITEHTNGTITIKNQGPGTVVDYFCTDVFANEPFAPSPPDTGEYVFESCWLDSGETICFDFYKLPHSTSSGTWEIWGLVDSWPNDWGNIHEVNESNNTYGPVNLTWENPDSPGEVSRADMIAHALEFVNVNWTCSNANAEPHWSCPSWTCDFSPGQNYTGEAYSWGGWDKPNTDFLTYLSAGLCAGSLPSNNCGQVDAYWATGVDCSGLVSRFWELPSRRTTSSLVYVSDLITIGEMQPGDIMNCGGVHVMMLYELIPPDSIRVIEATPSKVTDQNKYCTQDLLNQGYVPRRYKWIEDLDNNDPVIEGHIHCKYPVDECGDCIKLGEEMTIEVDASDEDGDLLYYEWVSYYGSFVVDGETTYVDTTTDNFITYLAPFDPWFPDDYLYVNVWDNRGGYAFIDAELTAYEEGHSCLCGDANDDGTVTGADVTHLLTYLFRGSYPPPDPILRADANNDCTIGAGDITYLLTYLFRQGLPPECCWFSPTGEESPISISKSD